MFTVVCAWHKLYFSEEATLVLYEWPNQPDGTSHGICSRCSQILLGDLETGDSDANTTAQTVIPQRPTLA